MTFKKGESGNPGGRTAAKVQITEMAKKYGPDALQYLASVFNNPKESTTHRITAAKELLDRGFGKAFQSVKVSGEDDGAPIRVHSNLDAFMNELAKVRKRLEETEIEE
jgi:hypothetical protein